MFSLTKLTSTKTNTTNPRTTVNDQPSFPTTPRQLARLWSLIATHPKTIAAIILLISMVLFLTLNVNGYWDFALPLRGKKLLALMVFG